MDFDAKAKTWDDDPMKTARAQAVANGIRAQVPLSTGMSGFEYGCGTGLLSFALQPDLGRITLADSSRGMLAEVRKKIAARGIGNMTPLELDLVADPRPAERYHLVCSMMTFHHIPDTDRILEEFHELLVPGGYLCIADLDSEDGSFHGEDFSGHRGFDRKDLERRALQAGFREVRFTTVFRISKGEGAKTRDFPVFLMVAQKA